MQCHSKLWWSPGVLGLFFLLHTHITKMCMHSPQFFNNIIITDLKYLKISFYIFGFISFNCTTFIIQSWYDSSERAGNKKVALIDHYLQFASVLCLKGSNTNSKIHFLTGLRNYQASQSFLFISATIHFLSMTLQLQIIENTLKNYLTFLSPDFEMHTFYQPN